MPKQSFTIKNTGQVIEIERNFFWRNIVVRLGDSEIGHFKTLSPLKKGQLFKTKIGAIHVRYRQTLVSGIGFDVWYNKDLLAGSISDPIQHWQTGIKAAIGLGLVNIVVGLITLFPYSHLELRGSQSDYVAVRILDSTPTLQAMGSHAVFLGIVGFILGLISWWRRSVAELVIAAVIFVVEAALSLSLHLNAKPVVNISIFVVMLQAVLIVLIVRSAFGARKINQPREKAKNS